MRAKKIAIILQQYSIVVKGVERKLKELKYEVTTIKPESDLLKAVSGETDLFILYLPKDSKNREEEEAIFQMMLQICDVMQTYQKTMVLIGEKTYRSNLMSVHPMLGECEWVDRPVNMLALELAVKRALGGEGLAKLPKHILIVDDDPTYASMVRTWIKDFYRVDILTSGKPIFQFLYKTRVDLILLDYEMPEMDGAKVLQLLQHDPTTHNIPVVFLTGVGTAEEVKQVLALKPEGYVLKSTTREQLLEYLAEKLK